MGRAALDFLSKGNLRVGLVLKSPCVLKEGERRVDFVHIYLYLLTLQDFFVKGNIQS
jgi:hypothetical protein